ncbi:uncharacterized protein LOC128549318 [Mercenaria mercenaria]|uniref:uncharacterized protein LOC128549318 n=1 Tax=Mercenaria mercenaria TaxID=6596 RepID=UPI00234E406B|nr:uncharacterized protein LOC128549318 [Mercenaria mercenaria]
MGKTEKTDPPNMVKIYKCLVVPHLEYAAHVWQIADCKPLDSIQRKILAACLGIPACGGIEALEVESNTLPLDLRREELSIRELARLLMRHETEPIKQTIIHWLETTKVTPERYLSPLGKMFIQVNDMENNTSTNYHILEHQLTYLEYMQPTRRPPEYWSTLGSSKNRSALQIQESKEIIRNQIHDSDIHTLLAFTDGIKTDIAWTPGHANIFGNEIADRLAKEAASEAETMGESNIPTTLQDIKKAAKKSCEMKWQNRWQLTDTGRHLHQCLMLGLTSRSPQTPASKYNASMSSIN